MADLRECPFCGGEAKGYLDNHKKAMIECKNCNMYFGVKLEIGCELVEGWKATFESKEELIEAWNTRKPMEAVVAELEKRANDNDRCADRLSGIESKKKLASWRARAQAFRDAISIVRRKE